MDSKKRLTDLLKRLISFQSISPGCGGAILFLAEYLKGFGFDTHIINSGGLLNLIATTNPISKNIDICFSGHIDVVDPGDLKSWQFDPFVGTVDDDKIYGRGVVDMKGAIACFIIAVIDKKLFAPNNTTNIGIIITSDEEHDSQNGIVPVLQHIKKNGYKIKRCIVGEPTCKEFVGDTIKIGRRGSVNFVVKVIGKQGHVAYPHNAKNPISFAAERLNKLIQCKLDFGSKDFEPSNCEITNIEVNNQFCNVIPKKLEIKLNIRFNNNHNVDSLKSFLNQIFYSSVYNCSIECIPHYSEPFVVNDKDFVDEFSCSVKKITGFSPSTSTGGGTSDARFLKDFTNVIEFGLVNSTAHCVNENACIDDMIKLQKIYSCFLP